MKYPHFLLEERIVIKIIQTELNYLLVEESSQTFCELNDPIDQEERFDDQLKQKDLGDIEAMFFDEDYINALKHGMPPAVGVGIGIDRLIMLLLTANQSGMWCFSNPKVNLLQALFLLVTHSKFFNLRFCELTQIKISYNFNISFSIRY